MNMASVLFQQAFPHKQWLISGSVSVHLFMHTKLHLSLQAYTKAGKKS